MRFLPYVLSEIIAVVSDSDELNQFSEDMQKMLERCSYTAPEDMGRHWAEAQLILNRYFTLPYEELSDLEKRVVDIWTNKE